VLACASLWSLGAPSRYVRLVSFGRFTLYATALLSIATGLVSAPAQAQEEVLETQPPTGSPRAERVAERAVMVRQQIRDRGISDQGVLDALLTVPRHEFVPAAYQREAYGDHPLPIGAGQTISQPYIVALMTQQLELESSDRVLEIGTGSGYQAAVASLLADSVFSIEIIKTLAESAAQRLERLGYRNVVSRHADGYYGWPEREPFDAIIVTAAAGHIPPPLVRQLATNGRMIIPVGAPFQVQHLVLVVKHADGTAMTRTIAPVTFVPLVGH
jgi:protein-L-isoaspartate(D-aspartate) O-methyltransferase